jgi:hypothetical protein
MSNRAQVKLMLLVFSLPVMLLIKRTDKQLLLLEQVVWQRWMQRDIWLRNIDFIIF